MLRVSLPMAQVLVRRLRSLRVRAAGAPRVALDAITEDIEQRADLKRCQLQSSHDDAALRLEERALDEPGRGPWF